MDRVDEILRRNLDGVERAIDHACRLSGRAIGEVTLVAVTKYVNAEVAQRLHELGAQNLAESRPQELWRKAAAVPEATWHLVGHLQRNKVDATLPLASLIHSVDSFRLLEALDQAASGKPGQRWPGLLLEFNLSGDTSKHGFAAEDSRAVADRISQLSNLRVVGLMTMAPLEGGLELARATFRDLRQLREEMRGCLKDAAALPHLSMGMTNDFEVAIEEGATLVRIGSALFRGLEGVDA